MAEIDPRPPAREAVPTRAAAILFQAKASLLQARRTAQNLSNGIHRHRQLDEQFAVVAAKSVTPLWTDTNPSELWYQQGKIQNLRLALQRLDRCVIPAGETFSFWQQVGRASPRKGYASGRMLQEGCMIPAIGGGLCQLSNALYQVALDAGCQITERHAHSRVVHGSATSAGRDATVAWNYIDLRFRVPVEMQLRTEMSATELSVSLVVREKPGERSKPHVAATPSILIGNDHACESCGEVTCFRHEAAPLLLHGRSRAAFLVDDMWPEFAKVVDERRSKSDLLFLSRVAPWEKTLSSLRNRFSGGGRQAGLLHAAESMAKRLAWQLTPGMDEVFVSQALLPFLWRAGVLGGRRVHVLMTQPPMRAMQIALDCALLAHPESSTLGDFRAPEWLVEAEESALAGAEQIITPHAYAASFFPAKTRLLEWSMPSFEKRERRASGAVLLPCSTLGRKGAYEVREAVRGLGLKVYVCGGEFEGMDFWKGIAVERAEKPDWAAIDAVLLPAITESQPRVLLHALSLGIPAITTVESGLHRGSGAQFVPMLDAAALREALVRVLAD